MTSTTSKNINDFEGPDASVSGILADDDTFITSPLQHGKIKSSENESADSGVSVPYDNNILSPAPSTASRFPDNLTSPHKSDSPELFDRPQTFLGTSGQTMDNPLGLRADDRTALNSEDANRNIRNMQRQMEWMKRNMELLKQENLSLQSALTNPGGSSWRDRPFARSSGSAGSNPAFLLSSFNMEMASFKAELSRINSSLESCELGRKSFSERWSNSIGSSLQQANQSLKELLLRNLENPVEKVLINSLQGRLKSTEDRLKRSRAEMNDCISKVEERLLLENVDLKMSEVEVRRKLEQTTNQVRAMRRNQQSLTEVCQKLRLRSSENGFVDLQEILKRLPVEEADAKSSGRKEEMMSVDALREIKDEVTKQVSLVAAEKQRLSSELSEAEDVAELSRKENEGLKKSMNELNSKWEANMADFRTAQVSTIERLLKQMETFSDEARQLCRCDDGASSTVRVLEDVVDTKDRLLSSALAELEKLKSYQEEKVEPPKQQNSTDQLSAIFDFMKFKAGETDATSATPHPAQDSPTAVSTSRAELARLTARCSELEHDVEFAEKNLDFQKEEVESLQAQLNASRDNLLQMTRRLDVSTSNEADLRRELKMHKEWLDVLNAQLLEKEKQLQLLELDKGSVQRLFEKDGANLERSEGDEADVKFIKQALELDLMSSRNALDASLKENLLLKQTLEQSARDLAAERDVTSASTYDKLVLQQELYAARQENDNLLKERDDMKRKISLLQLENQKLSSATAKGHDPEPDDLLQDRIKNLTAELRETKMKLEAKERDTAFFQDTLKFVLKSSEDSQAKKS